MKIVFATTRVPFPPNRGDRIRNHYILRHLAREHELHLVSLADPGDPGRARHELEGQLASVSLVEQRRMAVAGRVARAMFDGSSLVAATFANRRLAEAAANAAGANTDLLWVSNGALYPALSGVPADSRVVDLVDADSEKWRELGEHHRGPVAAIYRREAPLTRALETYAVGDTDRHIVVSRAEAESLAAHADTPLATTIVANGIDLEAFPRAAIADEPRIIFTGVLDYPPNVDAVLYFASEILPLVRRRVPATRFVAAGSSPTAAIQRAARRFDFEVCGDVPDIRPYLASARLSVAPMRLGRGTQNKVLEAMASGVAVVGTSRALEGLGSDAPNVAAAADGAEDFADRCVELLSDTQLATGRAEQAHRFVAEYHTWEASYAAIDAMLDQLRARPPIQTTLSAGAR